MCYQGCRKCFILEGLESDCGLFQEFKEFKYVQNKEKRLRKEFGEVDRDQIIEDFVSFFMDF